MLAITHLTLVFADGLQALRQGAGIEISTDFQVNDLYVCWWDRPTDKKLEIRQASSPILDMSQARVMIGKLRVGEGHFGTVG